MTSRTEGNPHTRTPDLRVLVVATQIEVPGTGGGQTHVRELIEHLGDHAQVLALTRRGSYGPGIVSTGVWPGLPPRGTAHLLSAINLLRSRTAVASFAPHVIYERGSSFGLGAMYSRLLKIPMLTMLLDEHISPLSLRQATHIITTNPSLVPDRYREKAVRVSWGANTQRFRPGLDGSAARARFGLRPNDYVVGYCGTFQRWHGLEVLLDVAQLTVDDPSLRFLLIGEHRRAAPLMREVKARGLEARFVFTDRVAYEDVPAALATADVCVAPFSSRLHRGAGLGTTYTLDPLKVFEYLALEKPVVTTAVHSVSELFEDGVHLRMVPEDDAPALASALRRLRSDPEGSLRMAGEGAARVRAQHTWRAHAAHLAQLFASMRARVVAT